jgi:predicted RNA-binding Zn ribbon-like protein
MTGPDLLRLRECPDPQCRVLFGDTSRRPDAL